MLNIVAKFEIVNEFKKSRYFRQNLGLVATVEKNGRRTYNEKDRFSNFYNTQYKTIIYGQGNIGDIKFYTDHFIRDNTFVVYCGDNFEEFLFEFDSSIIFNKGVDFYLGKIIKEVEEKFEEKIKNNELKKLEEKPKGNADLLTSSPGAVTYEDVKVYLEKKQKDRYKNNV